MADFWRACARRWAQQCTVDCQSCFLRSICSGPRNRGNDVAALRADHTGRTTQGDIIDGRKDNTAAHKYPRTVQFMDALPKSGAAQGEVAGAAESRSRSHGQSGGLTPPTRQCCGFYPNTSRRSTRSAPSR